MACVEKIKCPDCDKDGALQVFFNPDTDTYTSFCFKSCNEFKGNPYKDGERPEVHIKTEAEIAEEIKDVQKCQTFKGRGKTLSYRGIPGVYFSSWSVRLLLSEYDGISPFALGFPYSDSGKLKGWKVIPLDKKTFWAVGDTRDCDPFGLERALSCSGRTLYITEGEFDAIALDYCFVEASKNSKYAQKKYPVISLSAGAGSMLKNLKKIHKRIKNRFDTIVLVVDDDEKGLEAEKVAQKIFPDILRADKPSGCKDANDAVKAGKANLMANLAMWKAHKPPIEGIVSVKSVLELALEKPVMGLSYPYEELTEMTYGLRFQEACCLGAGVGSGKTVTAHEFAAWNMVVHKLPCFMILLEELNKDTLRNVSAKIDSIPYHNPKAEYDVEKFKATATSLQDHLFMWESEGDQALRFDMDEIITAIRFIVLEYKVKVVYIDNFTRLVDHLDPGEANTFINKYSSEIENLATQLDIHIMCYTHLNTPRFGPSHEEGAPVYASQFTGSRGIMRSFPVLMSFRRNKHADTDEGMSKNNSLLGVIKNRKYGGEGDMRMSYYPETGRLLPNAWTGELMNEEKKKGR